MFFDFVTISSCLFVNYYFYHFLLFRFTSINKANLLFIWTFWVLFKSIFQYINFRLNKDWFHFHNFFFWFYKFFIYYFSYFEIKMRIFFSNELIKFNFFSKTTVSSSTSKILINSSSRIDKSLTQNKNLTISTSTKINDQVENSSIDIRDQSTQRKNQKNEEKKNIIC